MGSSTPPQIDRFVRFAWATLGWNVFVIVWGAWVRTSGSGAGCGSHWPLCNGQVLPTDPAVETLIELTHRLTSGIALILVFALWWMARSMWARGEGPRRAAFWSLIFVLGEAALGAVLVLAGLVVDNASAARAWVMCFHLVNTFWLLAALALTALWARHDDRPARSAAPRLVTQATLALVGMLLVGATGAIAALGDTLFPASSLADGLARDLDSSSHILLRLRSLHPLFAVLVAMVILQFASAARRRPGHSVAGRANWLSVLVLVQVVLGGLNVVLLAPTWMQLVHLALADTLWIALIATVSAAFATSPPTQS